MLLCTEVSNNVDVYLETLGKRTQEHYQSETETREYCRTEVMAQLNHFC